MNAEERVIPNTTTIIRLSKFRSVTISGVDPIDHLPSAKFMIETYSSAAGQMKTFAFYIAMKDLSSIIDALTNVEQVGIDRGWILPVEADAAEGGAL
jgi:hypothetical protein